MIIVKNSGYLLFDNFKFLCAFGKNGIKKNKIEGDKATPRGIFKLNKVFYRHDRIKKIKTILGKSKITKKMGWCDDPNSKFYNKKILLPSKFKYEKLYRNDCIYDIIIVINYNIKPTFKNKGSAIFMHIARSGLKPTEGCIALKKKDLLFLLSIIKKNTQICIG
jgi:L,D-peptidoglycan transpeptidase YkuD (ErfK/YbiS/YcfS/YnhG family)